MSILDSAKQRYATKSFDKNKPISAEHIDQLKEVIRLSPSSINIQAWHFMVATTDSAKAKIATACPGKMEYNAKKIQQAPLIIVCCAHKDVGSDQINRVIEQETLDGRFATVEIKAARVALLANYIDSLNRQDPTEVNAWINKQTYIALGNVLLAAADMGIDSVPIEGYDNEILDKTLELDKKGLRSTVIAAFGYRRADDFNAALPKSRLPQALLFTDIG